MKKTRRLSLLVTLVCAFVLVLSLGVITACGQSGTGTVSETGGVWYYGATVPANGIGEEGDYYLNTKTLASYKKTANGWALALNSEEVGDWLYGVGAPTAELESKTGDFYLDTENGDLYQKTAEGWKNILKLFGKNGRSGVVWFSGTIDPNTYPEGDTTLTDAQKGDFYLDYKTFTVYQLGEEDTWKDLGSLKGETGRSVSWKTGSGYPAQDPAVEGELYFDTDKNILYQAAQSEEGLVWTVMLNAGKQTIDHIWHFSGLSGEVYYHPEAAPYVGTEGYFVYYKDGTHEFIGVGCNHLYQSDVPGNVKTIVYDNCETGEITARKCVYCGQWALSFREPSVASPHKYDTATWISDADNHWHEATCSHKQELGPIDMGPHQWVALSEKVSICSVCKYIYVDTRIETEADGTLVLNSVTDWQTFAKGVNSDATYEYGDSLTKKYSEANVKLGTDLDFTGQLFISAGVPSNGQEVFEITEKHFAELKNQNDPGILGGFKGTFDGQSHYIRGIKYDKNSALNFTGLFGYLNGGKVQNLVIKELEIVGDYAVGAVAGFMTGDDAKISGVQVIDCKVIGLTYVGGIVGYAYNAGAAVTERKQITTAAIENCTVKGTSYTGTWNSQRNYEPTMQVLALPGYTNEQGKYYNGYYGGGIAGISYGSTIYNCTVEMAIVSVCHIRKAIIANAVGTETRYAVTYGCKTGNREGNNVLFQNDLCWYTKNGDDALFDSLNPVIELDNETLGVESHRQHYDAVNGSTLEWWTTFHDTYCYSAGHSVLA